jgi:uncharacterized membrane protein YgcG
MFKHFLAKPAALLLALVLTLNIGVVAAFAGESPAEAPKLDDADFLFENGVVTHEGGVVYAVATLATKANKDVIVYAFISDKDLDGDELAKNQGAAVKSFTIKAGEVFPADDESRYCRFEIPKNLGGPKIWYIYFSLVEDDFSGDVGGRTVDVEQGAAPAKDIVVPVPAPSDNSGGSSSSSSSGGGGPSSSSSFGGGGGGSSSAPVAPKPMTRGQGIAAVKEAVNGVAALKNPTEVSLAVLKAMAQAAGAAGVAVNADTRTSSGAFDVRLTFNPGSATANVNLVASTLNTQAANAKARFAKSFSNKLSAVHLSQAGAYGMNVKVAVKLAPAMVKAKDIAFYAYNASNNSYSRLQTAYRVDANGFLHFYVEQGGTVIISEGPLTK